jgi:hypothetical protein
MPQGREEGFIMNNDFQLGNSTEIKGAFQSIPTFTLLSSLTGSDVYNQYRLKDGQIFFVTESQKFFRVNKTPTGPVYDFIAGNLTGDDLAQASFEWEGTNDITFTEVIFTSASYAVSASHASFATSASYAVSASHEIITETSSSHAVNADTALTASFISSTFISASAAAEGFGSGGTGDPTDISALNSYTSSMNTFTSSFTEEVDNQVRITIDAIPSESIFNFRENGSNLFGTKATGSITVDAGFGTNDKDTFFIDCQTDFVVRIQNFTDTSQFNNSVENLYTIGGVWNAQSTEQFLLTASAIINDNDDLGTINIGGITKSPDNAPIAGFLSSSVNGNTIDFVAKRIGTFANNIRVAFTGSNVSTGDAYLVPSSQVKQLGGGNNYNSNDIIASGSSIGNIAVLDISGSSDTSAALKRMDLLSFLDETSVLSINAKIDTLISQSNSRFYATNASKLDVADGDGTIGSADLLQFLAAYGQKADGAALPAPGTGTNPGERVAGSDTREGLREIGGVTDQDNSVLTNGTFTIANQSSGSLNIEGTNILSLPAKIDFTDKIGGDPGVSSSGVFTSSGSLLFYSESIGSFRFNRPLSASNLSGTNTGDQDLSSYIQASQTGSFLTSVPAGTLSSSAQIASDISGAFDSVSASLASDIPTVPVSSYTNSGNGRIITSVNSSTINGEQRLTYSNEGGLSITNGSTGADISLTVDSDIVGTDGHIRLSSPDGGGGSGHYISSSGDLAGGVFKLHFGDIENQGNNTTLVVDDVNEKITISKAISASGAITAQSFNGTVDGGSF